MANAALPFLNGALPPSKRLSRHLPAPMAEKLTNLENLLAAAGPEAFGHFTQAVTRESLARHHRFLAGITAYRRHPYVRDLPSPPVLWRDGTSRLLDYRTGADGAPMNNPADGAPVLAIPSLVNRAYVLDLTPKRSLMRGLAGRGVAPFLLDWDAPGEAERRFTLSDYMTRRLEPALEKVAALTGRRPVLLGYCMGGLLAAALAQRRPDLTAGLALLATPWDFVAAMDGRKFETATAERLVAGAEQLGEMPADWLNALFMTIDPTLSARKFSGFADLTPAVARDFVALEDWVNDSVPLATPVARECLLGWYGANSPAKGAWRIAGRTVDPERIETPTLAVIPWRDRIVPPDSALPLAAAIPGATVWRAAGGHVGMLLRPRAGTELYTPLAKWIKTTTGAGRRGGKA